MMHSPCSSFLRTQLVAKNVKSINKIYKLLGRFVTSIHEPHAGYVIGVIHIPVTEKITSLFLASNTIPHRGVEKGVNLLDWRHAS
jgi:hypothetical protein